jgi:fimbrial chaperone protein
MTPPRRRSRPTAAPLALLALLAAAGDAGAGSLGVSPTRLDLAPDQRAGVVTLQNNGTEPVLVQVQTFAWPDRAETAELEPTRELVAVPAVAELAPGKKQLIRVAARGAGKPDAETAYRLVITEVPPDPAEGRAGVRFALRFSLPVFLAPPGVAPIPAWSLEGAKPRRLVLRNRGSAHVQVRRLRLYAAGRAEPVQVIEQPAHLSYVLPGGSQAWDLAPSSSGGRLAIKADTDIGELEATVAPAGG